MSFVRREAELRDDFAFFGGVVAEGARLFRYDEFGHDAWRLRDSARSIVRHVVAKSRLAPVVLRIQHELVDEHKALDQTAAGVVVAGEIHKVTEDYKRQLAALQKDIMDTIRERNSNQKAEITDLKDEFRRKLRAAEGEYKVLESSMAKLQEREKQALLDRLEATETHFQTQLKQREEESRDMEESLRLMKAEAARQASASRQKANRELVEHESEVANIKQKVKNGQTAFNNLEGTTKNIRAGIVSGIAGSVTTAVLTGGMLFNQQIAVGIALLIPSI